MIKLFSHITLLLIASFLIGCKNDIYTINNEAETKADNVNLSFSTTITNQGSSLIKHTRIIAFNAEDGSLVYNKVDKNSQVNEKNNSSNFVINIKTGVYSMFVVSNESYELNGKLNLINSIKDLESIIFTNSEINEENMVMFEGLSNVRIKEDPNNPNTALASVDNGNTWHQNIPVSLDRIAAKVSLQLSKTNSSDEIKIVRSIIKHIPSYGSLIIKPYIGEYYNKEVEFDQIIELQEKETQIFDGVFSNENILQNPKSQEFATIIELTALYNGNTVIYNIPLGKWDNVHKIYHNYNVQRNTHYAINATISKGGIYVKDIVMTVIAWTNSNTDIDFDKTMSFDAEWLNADVVDDYIMIEGDGYVEFKFKAQSPKGSLWRAHIDNTLDFEIDNNHGNSSGVVSNQDAVIRIKPRKANSGSICSFYITVDKSEIDLNKNGKTGPQNRYKIKQK